jgi:hypothetical protein
VRHDRRVDATTRAAAAARDSEAPAASSPTTGSAPIQGGRAPDPLPSASTASTAPAAPAGVSLARWALVIHAGIWVLVTLAQAISLATGSAGEQSGTAVGSWFRLVLALAVTAALVVTAQRLAWRRRPAWLAALALQLIATAGYAVFTWLLATASEPGLVPTLPAVLLGAAVVLASALATTVLLTPSTRRYCLGARR